VAVPEAPIPAPGEVPDWLQEIAPPEVAPPAAEAVPEVAVPEAPIPAPGEVPDWLQEIAPPEAAHPEAAPAEPVVPFPVAALEEAVPPVPAEMPEWLQEVVPPEAETAEAVAPFPEPALEEAPAPSPTETLDWLTELEAGPALPSGPAAPVFEGAALASPEAEGEELARRSQVGWRPCVHALRQPRQPSRRSRWRPRDYWKGCAVSSPQLLPLRSPLSEAAHCRLKSARQA